MILSPQSPSSVVMIRPHNFCVNQETKDDNCFQQSTTDPQLNIKQQAYEQVSQAKQALESEGVTVHLFEDKTNQTPDSVFPNNWFSTHAGGYVAIYPMYACNRRKERRNDIIEFLKKHYRVQSVIDYSGLEYDRVYLEGTGAMVLDHVEHVAYAVKSKRTNTLALERFCSDFNFEPIAFDAEDESGNAVYHTNVLMCIGSEFVMAGFDMLPDVQRRNEIIRRFEQAGKCVIKLTSHQIKLFCGNAIELQGRTRKILALSLTAYQALKPEQLELLNQCVKLVPIDVSSIEQSGGSVRCMLAGIHLSKR